MEPFCGMSNRTKETFTLAIKICILYWLLVYCAVIRWRKTSHHKITLTIISSHSNWKPQSLIWQFIVGRRLTWNLYSVFFYYLYLCVCQFHYWCIMDRGHTDFARQNDCNNENWKLIAKPENQFPIGKNRSDSFSGKTNQLNDISLHFIW